MGVAKAWDAFDPVVYNSIQLWSDKFFRENGRCARLAVDMPQWVFMVLTSGQKSGGGREHRSLIERLLTFMACGVDLVAVFDGMAPLPKLRHGDFVREGVDESPMVLLAKRIVTALGLPCIDSPSEGEAQCVHLQSQGHVDFVFSNDADILGYGATDILFFNTTDSDSKVVREVHNDVPGSVYVMKALLQGNDYHTGVVGLGPKTAVQISAQHTGFAEQLEEIFANHDSSDHRELLWQWSERVSVELRANSHGYLKGLPQDFPCPEVVEALLRPPVNMYSKLEWKRPNWKLLEEIWMDPSPIPISEEVLGELKARADQTSPESRRQALHDKFRDRISAPALVDAIRHKYDNPRWYGDLPTNRLKKPLGVTFAVPLKPLCPWRHKSGSVTILSCLLRLSSSQTLIIKRDQKITSFFQSIKRIPTAAKRTKSDTCASAPKPKAFRQASVWDVHKCAVASEGPDGSDGPDGSEGPLSPKCSSGCSLSSGTVWSLNSSPVIKRMHYITSSPAEASI